MAGAGARSRRRWAKLNREGGDALISFVDTLALIIAAGVAVWAIARGRAPSLGEGIALGVVGVFVVALTYARIRRRARRDRAARESRRPARKH